MAYMDGNILDEEFIGTQANWDIEDAVIEIGLVILTQDTDVLKIGNGIHTFADLEELIDINDITELIDVAAYIDTTLSTEYFEKLAFFDPSFKIKRSDYLEDDFLIGDDFSEVQGVLSPLVCGYMQKMYGTSFTLNADSISAYREKGSYIDHYEWTTPEGVNFDGIDIQVNVPNDPELIGTFLRYRCVAVDNLGNRSSKSHFNILISDIDGPALDVAWGVQDSLISAITWDDDIHYENESYVMTVTPVVIEGLTLDFSVTCNDSSVNITPRSAPNENIFDIEYGEYHSNTTVIFTITVTNGAELTCSVGNIKTIIDKNPMIGMLSWDTEDHHDVHAYVMTIIAVDPNALELTYEFICDDIAVNITQRSGIGNEHIFDVVYPDYSQDTNVNYTATITNSEGLFNTATDAILVTNEISSPTINNISWNPVGNHHENTQYVLTIDATDPQSQNLTYDVQCDHSAPDVVIASTGSDNVFNITYGEYIDDANIEYTITVTNTSLLTDVVIEPIVVYDDTITENPDINSIIWNPTGDQYENESYEMTINAIDPQSLSLTYLVECNPSTGVNIASTGSDNVFNITYDEFASDTNVDFTITVTNTLPLSTVEIVPIIIHDVLIEPPDINSISWNPTGDQYENNTYEMTINASDPQSQTLTYAVDSDHPSLVTIDSPGSNNVFNIDYSEVASDTNVCFTITVTNTEPLSTVTHDYVIVMNM